MKVLVFDTETTGLIKNYNASMEDSSKWPHVLQLSFIVFDTNTKEILDYSDRIIRLADNVDISPESIAIHQITRERSNREGIPIRQALLEFIEAMKGVDILVAHNLIFDKTLLQVELCRHKLIANFISAAAAAAVADAAVSAQTLLAPKEYCTMQESITLCKIPNPNKKYAMSNQYKWPRLNELHKQLFKVEPNGTHNAIADVMICLRCYIYMNYQYDIATDEDVKIIFRNLYANYCGAPVIIEPKSQSQSQSEVLLCE